MIAGPLLLPAGSAVHFVVTGGMAVYATLAAGQTSRISLPTVLGVASLVLLGVVVYTLRLNVALRRTRAVLERQLAEGRRQQGRLREIAEERRRLEEQLLHSQKMEALGRLAGGVAHDFNNVLTVIECYCEGLLEQLPEQSGLRSDVGEIRDAGRRAGVLTRQLLAFSRRQMIEARPLDLGEAVKGSRPILERLAGPRVDLRFEITPGLPMIHSDPVQLEQALCNLVSNARDAMARGGSVTIGAAEVTLEDPAGQFVCLSVSDTGCGMDVATQSRVFEPFFTTKETGKGTGLGLSTVYGVVHQCGGHIRLRSAPGQGSTFDLFFPAQSGEHARRAASGSGAA